MLSGIGRNIFIELSDPQLDAIRQTLSGAGQNSSLLTI